MGDEATRSEGIPAWRGWIASDAEDADEKAADLEKCRRMIESVDPVMAKRFREMAYHHRIIASVARGDRDGSGISVNEAYGAGEAGRFAGRYAEMAARIEASDPDRAARCRRAAELFSEARDILSGINPKAGKAVS